MLSARLPKILKTSLLCMILAQAGAAWGAKGTSRTADCVEAMGGDRVVPGDAPSAVRELIRQDVLFAYMATYDDVNEWAAQSRQRWGSRAPSRQEQRAMDNVLLEGNGSFREEPALWFNLAAYSWHQRRESNQFASDAVMRIIQDLDGNEAYRHEFIRLYAALLREYLTAIKGSGSSLAAAYESVVQRPKSPPIKKSLLGGSALGALTAVGIFAAHALEATIGISMPLVWLAVAPAAMALPPAVQFAARFFASLRPAKAYSIFKGDALLEELRKNFDNKLNNGYSSSMYWSLRSDSSAAPNATTALDLANYQPLFTDISEANAEMGQIIAEFNRYGADDRRDFTSLSSGLRHIINFVKAYVTEYDALAKTNAADGRDKLAKGIKSLYNMLTWLVEDQQTRVGARAARISQLQEALRRYSARLQEQQLDYTSDVSDAANGAALVSISENLTTWTAYCAVASSQNLQNLQRLNAITAISRDVAALGAFARLDDTAVSNARKASLHVIDVLQDWKTGLMAGRSGR